MARQIRTAALLAISIVGMARPVAAEITAPQVRKSIDQAVQFLRGHQSKSRGNWPEYQTQPGGITSLCTLALLNAGVPAEDPALQRSLDYLRALEMPQMTYANSLQTMVFCAAEPAKDRLLISRNVKWLESIQIRSGARKGSWAYSDRQGSGDNSNTQFALLALYEAERVSVEVDVQTWRLALRYWLDSQKADGSWGYFAGQPSTGSMTCAGIASVVIASGRLGQADARVENGTVRCCGQQQDDDSVERALTWLGKKFSVTSNPSMLSASGTALSRTWLLYYLYGAERVGRLTGRRFLGDHDWYREGAQMLVAQQNPISGYWKGVGHAESNPVVATALALLFLSKGRRPVVISKLKHGADEDWNLHRQGVHQLTRYVEHQWKRELTWQTIDAGAATLENLMETPVLFISGQRALSLSADQEQALQDYIHQGGFIFAEACQGEGCDGRAFDQSFRALMQRLFPDSQLRLLPPDHAVWYAQQRVDPRYMRPLYGIDACCRTSVVYCPQNLSCYWELGGPRRGPAYPADVRGNIEACQRIGANVLAYATNRELKEKLDRPAVLVGDPDPQSNSRGTLLVPKLSHGGGSDDAPNALLNMLRVFHQETRASVALQRVLLTPTDDILYEHPIVFMHGRRSFRFSEAQRAALATYVRRGGFVFADAICASPQFAEAFRREWAAILPDHKLVRVPLDHPLLSSTYRGYDVSRVTLRDPQVRGGDDPLQARLKVTTPVLEGIELDGRLAVVFSPYDISCAMESHASLECKGYVKADAARLAVNILLYALRN